MKNQLFKNLSPAEVRKLLSEKRAQLLQLNMDKKIKGLEGTHQIRSCRRSIARLLTLKA